MKSVPSLVASSTVGAAATGLVFGRPQHSTFPRPVSNKRKAAEYENGKRQSVTLPGRPATSATFRTPTREQHHRSSPTSNSRTSDLSLEHELHTPAEGTQQKDRQGLGHRRRGSTPALESGSDERKDSLSSRGSWYKRLSAMQISHTSGSPRSSVGPDSALMNLSHGSAAPILNSPSDAPAQLPPNKLVKRAYSGRVAGGDVSRHGSRSKVPTLRRPATSHQRSATIQQQFREQESSDISASPTSLEEQEVVHEVFSSSRGKSHYRHYFESRTTKTVKEKSAESLSDPSGPTSFFSSRRVTLPDRTGGPTLLKAEMILNSIEVDERFSDFDAVGSAAFSSLETTPEPPNTNPETHKRPKRTLSRPFSSHTTWMSRSSSIRTSKRGEKDKAGGGRYASAPLPPVSGRGITTADPATIEHHEATASVTADALLRPHARPRASTTSNPHSRQSSASPLPVLSRLSSFNFDLARAGLSASSSGRQTPASPALMSHPPLSPLDSTDIVANGKASPKVVLHQRQPPRVTSGVSDQASTLIGSDSEVKEYTEDDEDTDFQSESVFDSFRTAHTGSTRVRSPGLESMFDVSPVSATGRPTGVTLNDYVVSTSYRDAPDRIMEEDEGMMTPLRASIEENFATPTQRQKLDLNEIRSSPPSFSLANQGFARLMLDDEEEDEDWTKDDDSDAFSSSLSPPSTYNSRRINPAVRAALADTSEERPKSVFDWSEPSIPDKLDAYGQTPRPKTVHGKQPMLDGRGGRAVGRRGPNALHIRSQSVPVVPQLTDTADNNSAGKKFGTWGLGAKGASEDWDNDFDFDGTDLGESSSGGGKSASSSMTVPASIQASQAIVAEHVGQIREVCSLVEDLKRLKGLAKEMGLLYGKSAPLWRQADGIIALATADEDDSAFSPPRSPIGQTSRHESITDQLPVTPIESVEANYTDRPARFVNDNFHNRRRSVFSPDDDIFGTVESSDELELPRHAASPRSKDSSDVARSVMEQMHHHRIVSKTLPVDEEGDDIPKQMPFDTTSLKDLVSRASRLVRDLSAIIRKHDGSVQSPTRSPENRRGDRDSSPAFTRVFTPDNLNTPPPLPRSQSGNSVLGGNLDSSPTRHIAQRMHMMTAV